MLFRISDKIKFMIDEFTVIYFLRKVFELNKLAKVIKRLYIVRRYDHLSQNLLLR